MRLFKLPVMSLLVAVLLTACGFHLRGDFDLPKSLSSVFINSKNNSELVQDLKLILKTNGATVVTDATLASAVIKIEKEKNIQRVISVDNSGRAREFEIKYSLTYSVSTVPIASASINPAEQAAKLTIASRQLELVRDYVYDSEAVLGKSREQSELIRDMQRDAARVIMLQIQAAHRKASSEAKISDTEIDANAAVSNQQ